MVGNGAVSIGRTRLVSLVILICFGFFGCASPNTIVNEDKRILLVEEGSSSGVFKDVRLTVEYSYILAGDNLTLTGNANFSGRYNSLSIYLLFLDQTGRRIDKKLVYSSLYRSMGAKLDRGLEKTLKVPAGTVAISFSHYYEDYNGRE